MQLDDISRYMRSLLNDKRYEEVLETYRTKVHRLFSMDNIKNNVYIPGYVVQSLRKLNKPDAAISYIFQTLRYTEVAQLPPYLLSELGWSSYLCLKNELNSIVHREQADQLRLRVFDAMRCINRNENYLLFKLLFFKLIEHCQNQTATDLEFIEEVMATFDATCFSTEVQQTQITRNNEEKDIELASDCEKWYMLRSKNLMALQRYEEVVALCRKALDSVENLHYNNHRWFRFRIANALLAQGKTNEAVPLLEQLLTKRSDWFIEKLLAEAYFALNRTTDALCRASRACVGNEPRQYKVELYKLMGDIYFSLNNKELAYKHYQLAVLIRRANNWSVSQQLVKALSNLRDSVTDCPDNADQLCNQLQKVWKATAQANRVTGTVTKILHEGAKGDGFITADDGKSYYFRMSDARQSKHIIASAPVSFEIIETQHRGKVAWQAVEISLRDF